MRNWGVVAAILVAGMPLAAQEQEPPPPRDTSPSADAQDESECHRKGRYPVYGAGSGTPWDDLDPAELIPLCEGWIAGHPQDYDAMATLGRVLYKAGRHEDALAAMEPALAAGNPWAQVNAGNMFREGDTRWSDGRPMKDYARAKDLFEAAAAQDFPWAYGQLGSVYRNGWGVERDIHKAIGLWRKASEAGAVSAYRDLARALVDEGELDEVYPEEALDWMKRAGAAGDSYGYNDLGLWYQEGKIVPRDLARAEEYFRLGAKAGNSFSSRNLSALLLRKDRPGGADREQAIAILEQAGGAGDALAWNSLGLYFLNGDLVPRDLARAESYFEKAIAGGAEYGPGNLANTLLQADRQPAPDPERAVALLTEAAENGNRNANIRLAGLYYEGIPIERDYEKARKYYEVAAAEGDAGSLEMLGIIHRSGLGVDQDRDKAFAYTLQAAEAGDQSAMFRLAELYENGNGTVQDLDQADSWFRRTAFENPRNYGEDYVSFLIRHGRPADPAETLSVLERAARLGNGAAISALAWPSEGLKQLALEYDPLQWRDQLERIDDTATFAQAVSAFYVGNLAQKKDVYAYRLIERSTALKWGEKLATEMDYLRDYGLYGLIFDRVIEVAALSDAERAERGVPRNYETSFRRMIDAGSRWSNADIPENFVRMKKLAELGYPGAAKKVYSRHLDPRDPAHDIDAAIAVARRLAEQDADAGLARVAYAMFRRNPDDPAIAVIADQAIAAEPDDYEKALLAHVLYEGRWGKPDYAVIAALVANAGDETPWLMRLTKARLLWEGHGLRQDRAAALELLFDAGAGIGQIAALIGDHFAAGAGVEKDERAALHHWRLAEQWNTYEYGPERLARAAVIGIGEEADAASASHWLREAALRGSHDARGWIKQCAGQETLACYRSIPELAQLPLAPSRPLAVRGWQARIEELESKRSELLTGEFRGGDYQDANGKLISLYQMADDAERLRSVFLDRIAYQGSEFLREEGTEDSFFYQKTMSCYWGKGAAALKKLGRIDDALFFAKQAVNHLQTARRRLEGLETPFQDCFLEANGDRYRYLADLFVEQGRFAEAETVLAMLKDHEHTEYVRGPVQGDTSKQDVALMPAEDALSRQYAQAFVALRNGSITREEARAQFAAANGAFRERLVAMRDEAAEMDADAIGDSDREEAVRRVSMALMRDLRSWDEKTAALHAIVMPDRLHWIITTTQYQQAVTIPIAQADLRKRVALMRENIIYEGDMDSAASGKLGYDEFFAPVDAVLRELGMDRLLVSLDDALRYIPLSALHDGEDFLVRRYAVNVIRERSDIARAADEKPDERVAAFGMSKAAAGFSALTGVPQELRSIVADDGGEGFIPGMIRLDEQFDRDALVTALAEAYPVIHLASHFSLAPNSPDQSVLLLGDGNTVSLSDLTLDGEFNFFDARLLTLSACQTGLSGQRADGREIDSLAALAQEAGVPAVLASLWSVSDASTARLMREFYRQWLESGKDKARAMQTAQLALLDDPSGKFAEPFFWSAFLVMGDGR